MAALAPPGGTVTPSPLPGPAPTRSREPQSALVGLPERIGAQPGIEPAIVTIATGPWSASPERYESPTPVHPRMRRPSGGLRHLRGPSLAAGEGDVRIDDATVWTWMTRVDGADLLSEPGARGGLDARLGAFLDPRTRVSTRNHRECRNWRTCSPVHCPASPSGDTAEPLLDAGALLIKFGCGKALTVEELLLFD